MISKSISVKFCSALASCLTLNESGGVNINRLGSPKILQTRAIKPVQSSINRFLSSVFVIPKKNSGHRPVINLKKLNCHIPYFFFFKMEGLFLLKEDYMCKIDLKDAYFSPTRF